MCNSHTPSENAEHTKHSHAGESVPVIQHATALPEHYRRCLHFKMVITELPKNTQLLLQLQQSALSEDCDDKPCFERL